MKTLIYAISVAFAWKDAVIIYGGSSNTTAAYIIDTRNEEIVKMPYTMPGTGRFYHSTVALNGELYLIGGQEPSLNVTTGRNKSKPTKMTYSKTAHDEEWQLLANGDMVIPRSRMATAVYNGRIWACGGRGREIFGSLILCESFNGRKWKQETPMIGTPEWKGRQGRDRFAMVATDQGLMAIGGHNSYRKVPQKSTEIYTSSAGVWLPGPKMENERFGHEAIVYENSIFVFGGLMDPDASILRLDNFQSGWKKIGQMKNPARLKFSAVLSKKEVFIYGGKCERLMRKKKKNTATYDACHPMAEVFSVVSYKSKAIDFDIPGNLEAQGMLFAEYGNATDDIDLSGEISARNLFSADFEFANYFEDEELEEEQRLNDFIQTISTSDDQTDESDEIIEYDEEYYNYESTEANIPMEPISASLVDLEDENKDGSFEDFFPGNFNLPIGNLSQIVNSLVRRFKDDTLIARNTMQCWNCDARSYSDCSLTSFETCTSDEQTCGIRVDKQNGKIQSVKAGCINPTSCLNLKAQNAAVDVNHHETFKFNQCRPETNRGASVCRQCCFYNQCNLNWDPVTTGGWNA